MKTRWFLAAAALLTAFAGLEACTDAIYATIETEKKVATNTLDETLTVTGIAATAAGSTYYVAAGGIFQGILSGPNGTVSWTPNSNDSARPFNPSGLICNGMALAFGSLWGGFINQSGSAAFYESIGAFPTPTFAGGVLQTDATVAGKQVGLLQTAGPAGSPSLFLCTTVDKSTYDLVTMTNATTFTAAITGLLYPVTGVGFDGSTYYMGTTASDGTPAIYTSASPTSFGPGYTRTLGSFTLDATDRINGIYGDPTNGRVFVLTKTGGVYYLNGGTWYHIPAETPAGSINPASFLTAAGPVDTTGSNAIYLVGSDGFGYYTLDLNAGSMDRFGDTTILLYTSSVSHILFDDPNVLLGTNGDGLWRGVFDTTGGSILSGTNQYWIHE